MPRQADIARIAGVSQATVSVVLGGNSAVRMAESTRRRVLEVAEQLGYVPHPVATRLASARSNLLGLYTFRATFPTDVADSYYPILVGVEEEAAALGQDLILFTGTSGPGASHEAAIRRTRMADGCLFFGRHVPEEPVARLVDSGFPLVYIGRRAELDGRIPYVGADYVSASAEVLTRLKGLGHREIRYVRESDEAPSSTDRQRGVLEAAPETTVVRIDGPELDPGTVRAWVRDGVTAVVVEGTDTGAAYTAVRKAIDAARLSTPDDLSLAVLGGPPEVSGFAVPMREMGRRAVRLLVDLVTERQTTPQQLLWCPPVAGSTVGAPRTR
ncbi:LacI family transcriptional regulator [Amycolatopsis acidiphila]|uniref:LacI family transcriptional regulator n=1 Tax=Amycolatopsis acidiphila TaxID=715473 RepID=A0A558A1J3_9PSEU|nr:LacI family DNA-binding transcriptional regulator [Amycolatopsis acidiphila]TVT18134.1 LacI family transcriptional regulator [Amycolatopsis acidiphila]UIJ61946.1 LacI family transcriptional regulator [Amycolatopsis acidiphila]